MDTAQEKTTTLGPIMLAPGITKQNALAAVVAAISMNAMLAFINVIQPIIIEENLGVPTSSQGTVSGNLTFISELVGLTLLGLVGALSDRIGRRPIIAFGFVALAAGYALYPLMTSVNALYLSRAIFAVGVSCVAGMMTTILNDYPQENSRGKMMALGGVSNGIGGVLMALVLAQLPLWFQQSYSSQTSTLYTSYVAATICIISALILYWGLHPMRGSQSQRAKGNILVTFRDGLSAAKNTRVAIAYAAAFVARSDLVVIGTFFLLWCRQSGIEKGMDAASATAQSGILFAIMQVAALVSAPLLGILIDKVDRLTAVSICMLIVAIGYFGLGMVSDPLSLSSYFVAILIGAGMMAGMLSSQALIGESAAPELRGSIIGVFGLSGAVGILFITSVGGIIYDHWMRTGPFLVIALMGLILSCVAIAVRRHESKSTTFERTTLT